MNYEPKDLHKEIKQALLQGGLVVADRGTGKTRAIAEILLEDPDAVAVVTLDSHYKCLFSHLIRLGLSSNTAKSKLIIACNAERALAGSNKNIYVDECLMSPYKGPFKGAVTSYPYSVKVVR